MGSKEDALAELEAVIKEYDLADSTVGRDICNDPHFMDRMRDERLTVTARTLDNVGRYILRVRGQLDLDLD